MKYIDPSYQIRAVPTNCNDRIYCKVRIHNPCDNVSRPPCIGLTSIGIIQGLFRHIFILQSILQ